MSAIVAGVIPKIEGFQPIPNAVMIPFMEAQSAALAYGFGLNYEYGKRKIRSMTNDEYNSLTSEDITNMSNAHTHIILSKFQAQVPRVMPMQEEIFKQYVTIEKAKVKQNFELAKWIFTFIRESVVGMSDDARDAFLHQFGMHFHGATNDSGQTYEEWQEDTGNDIPSPSPTTPATPVPATPTPTPIEEQNKIAIRQFLKNISVLETHIGAWKNNMARIIRNINKETNKSRDKLKQIHAIQQKYNKWISQARAEVKRQKEYIQRIRDGLTPYGTSDKIEKNRDREIWKLVGL